MKNPLLTLYNNLPPKFKNAWGKSSLLKPLRDVLLRTDGIYRETEVRVQQDYLDYKVDFKFFASFKTAAKASKHGIESTLLRNSIKLLKDKGIATDSAVILDIGANFGYLSLVWAQTVSANGKIISFEPNPNVFRSLSKSITTNNLNRIVLPKNLAVGKQDGSIELFLSSTTSNVEKSEDQSNKSTVVNMVAIDNFMENIYQYHCDLIKIDVDGIELDILNGASGFIEKCGPIVIVETNNDPNILDYFKNRSYKILDMKLNEYVEGQVLPPNIFCIYKS